MDKSIRAGDVINCDGTEYAPCSFPPGTIVTFASAAESIDAKEKGEGKKEGGHDKNNTGCFLGILVEETEHS